jgi:mannose-1-phosphate guanylyltransferase
MGRNTAPCIALAAAMFAARDPAATMLVLPADHLIQDTAAFAADVALAGEVAQETGRLVTFGLPPTRPHTGFGYIEAGPAAGPWPPGVMAVAAFKEKPDRPTAEAYLAAANFWWNSGIFVWPAQAVLARIEQYLPALWRAVESLRPHLGTPNQAQAVDRFYRDLPAEAAVSIDHGVLEPAAADGQVMAVQAGFDWDDLGGWEAAARYWPPDDQGNAVGAAAGLVARDAAGNIVYAPDKLVCLAGVGDLVVVALDDAVLVCPRDAAEEIKDLVARLESGGRDKFL